MWFGNLISVKWWNDLWLKESFADYCCCICLTECEDFKYLKDSSLIMLHFGTMALIEDSKCTTHPISVEINHTNDALEAYDSICYRKGAKFLN